MHLLVHTQHNRFVYALALALLTLAKLAIEVRIDVTVVEIAVDGIVERIDFLFGFALGGVE